MVTLLDFKNIASSSGLSGINRVVVKDGRIAAKNLWQQFRMIFMPKKSRQNLNKSTISIFCQIIKKEYGNDIFINALNSEDQSIFNKFNEGKKLLSRDVDQFIKKCDEERARCQPHAIDSQQESNSNKNNVATQENEKSLSIHGQLATITKQKSSQASQSSNPLPNYEQSINLKFLELPKPTLKLGVRQQDDPDNVVKLVDEVYGSDSFNKLKDEKFSNIDTNANKPDQQLTSQEKVSIYYCTFAEHDRNKHGQDIYISHPYEFYREKSICQERMNDYLKGRSQDNVIQPMLRQAMSGLDKLPDFHGTVLDKRDPFENLSEYGKGNGFYSKNFRTFDAATASFDEIKLKANRDNMFVYNMKGSACKDVSSITGRPGEVVVKPDAVYTCTHVERCLQSATHTVFVDVS